MKNAASQTRLAGFTLIELVMVILITSIIGAMTISFLNGAGDSEKWEETRQKMEAIRVAVLGDDKIDTGAERTRYGYFGDMGRLPPSLTVLTGSEAPAWSFNTYYGVGAGWRGPYFNLKLTNAYGVELDAWGRAFVYSTTSNPPSVASYGADGVAGGTVYGADLTVNFLTSERLSTVRGVVMDGGVFLSNEVLRLMYPVNGTLTATVTTADAQGGFLFAAVPFGRASLVVTSLSPALGPVVFPVDQPQVALTPNLLDRFGSSAVTYNSGSAVASTSPITINSVGKGTGGSQDWVGLTYTVPASLGSNLALILTAYSEKDTKAAATLSTAEFGATAMTKVITTVVGPSAGLYFGMGMYALAVTAGQTGQLAAHFGNQVDESGILAFTLANVASATAEATAGAINNSGNTSASIVTLNNSAVIVTQGLDAKAVTLDTVGAMHVLDGQQKGALETAGMGHLLASTAGTYGALGFTASSTPAVGVLLAAFTSLAGSVSATLTSTYRSVRTLAYLTARWGTSASMTQVVFGGVTQNVGRVPSGTRVQIQKNMQIAAGSSSAVLTMVFTSQVNLTNFAVTLEWTTGEKDTINFTTP